jgi:Protein of unknown function (DUF3833)
MRLFAAALLLALTAAPATAGDPPRLDMHAFFTGRTHADNNLHIIFHRATKLIVDSVGHREGNQFILIDTVHEGDKPVRMRKWVTHEIGPGHFTGTLSDATGPVDIVVRGETATIRYIMKGNLQVTEVMKLQPDGRTLSNDVDVRRFGLRFARVDGTVRKMD